MREHNHCKIAKSDQSSGYLLFWEYTIGSRLMNNIYHSRTPEWWANDPESEVNETKDNQSASE